MTDKLFMGWVRRFLSIFFLAGLILISGCESKKNLNPGFLEGTISIGPICPVERVPPDPACLPTAETYKAYAVGVFALNGGTKILQLMPSLDGSYTTQLPPGNYLVKLSNPQINIGGSNLPVEISITSQEKTSLDINIDTGIR